MATVIRPIDPPCCNGPWALPADVRLTPLKDGFLTDHPEAIQKIHSKDCANG